MGLLQRCRAVVAMAVVIAGSASAAAARPVPVPVAAAAQSPPVANPRAGYATWRESATEQVVRTDAGRQRSFTVPADCAGAQAAPDAVVFSCSMVPVPYQLPAYSLGFLNLSDGSFTQRTYNLNTPGYSSGLELLSAGRQWLLGQEETAIVQHDFLINRSTGAAIDLTQDPFGPHQTLDLDSASGASTLCPPVRRRAINPFKASAKYYMVAAIGTHTLDDAHRLTDCATRKSRRVGGAPLLSRRYLATRHYSNAPAATRTYITRFDDGSRRTLKGRLPLALSRRGLWLIRAPGNVFAAPFAISFLRLH